MQTDTKELKEAIIRLTSDNWGKSKRPLLLSALGPLLVREGINFKEIISPLKLLQYIKFSLDSDLEIVYHPTISEKVGLVPSSEEFSYAEETTLTKSSLLKGQTPSRRVKPSLWAAFLKPVPPKSRRLIRVTDSHFRFRDAPVAEVPVDGEVVLEQEIAPKADLAGR